MYKLKSVCVYCGSGFGEDPAFLQSAINLAQAMIARDIELVYGGANKGLMKAIADEFIKHRKKVTGVIPKSFVDMGLAHENITETLITETMTERRTKIMEISDGFIALPGGIGTFREILETLSFTQLDILRKPCGVLNVSSFYDSMIQFLDHCVLSGFATKESRDILFVSDNPNELLDSFFAYDADIMPKYFEQKYSLNNNNIRNKI